MNPVKNSSYELIDLTKKRAKRFAELSAYIKAYGLEIEIEICLKGNYVIVEADLLSTRQVIIEPAIRLIIRESIIAYLTGKFYHNIDKLIMIADDHSLERFPYSEISSILAVFFLRKRVSLGVSTGYSSQSYSRYVAYSSGFMNDSHAMRSELLEIKANTAPETKLAKFFGNLIWQEPPTNISINEILYAFGHLGLFPLQWFYVYHIFSKPEFEESILQEQAHSVLSNFCLQDRCTRVPSKALLYVVEQFMGEAHVASNNRINQNRKQNLSRMNEMDPIGGGAQFFYKGRYYHYTVFGSWLHYCADQLLSPRPCFGTQLQNYPGYNSSVLLKDYILNKLKGTFKRIIALHIKDGSYKEHTQLSRLVPQECYHRLFETHEDTLFIIVGEKYSEIKFPSIYSNVLSLSSLCEQYSCDFDLTQLLCLEWVDGYITSASGNFALAELFQIPSLLLGGLDSFCYSSFITRMPSRLKLNDIPLTNSFYRNNITYVEYEFGSEYNGLADSIQVDYLTPSDVLRAYSHYISHLDSWRERKSSRSRCSGPFAISPSEEYIFDPLRLYQASLSSSVNRIDPWAGAIS